IDADGGFSHASFAGSDGDDVPDSFDGRLRGSLRVHEISGYRSPGGGFQSGVALASQCEDGGAAEIAMPDLAVTGGACNYGANRHIINPCVSYLEWRWQRRCGLNNRSSRRTTG